MNNASEKLCWKRLWNTQPEQTEYTLELKNSVKEKKTNKQTHQQTHKQQNNRRKTDCTL